MIYNTEIKINGEKITVGWESYTDTREPEGKMFFEGTIYECPEWAIKKYGEGVIIFACRTEEEEKSKERKVDHEKPL